MTDSTLESFASPRQLEILRAVQENGSLRRAAIALGINQSNVSRAMKVLRAKAARSGYSPDHDMTHPVPDGFRLKGTSTLYDEAGEKKLQWVKSTIDHERQEEMFRAAVEGMAADLPRSAIVKPPKETADHLMACYPVGDHHFGMLAWHEETGEDYDIKRGEKLLMGAMNHLVRSVPSCGSSTIVLLGDFLHYDSFETVTPSSKHQLDADSRYPRMVRAAIRAVRYMIQTALEMHAKVHVIIEIGNHDLSSSIFLMECLHNIYEDETRVSIDRSPSHYHYFTHGKCLVGVHHGHGSKMNQLPLVMAADRAKEWGDSEYRYWWTGHVHHDQVKDHAGCRTESFRILPPPDAWAANNGYRAGRDMKAIILHAEYGEVARHIVNPAMLAAPG